MRVGISFVDSDGARRNLDAEAPDSASFDAMRADTYAAWNTELNRLRVDGGTLADRRTFYTALYHALLHPNVFTDVDGRYRGFDDAIHDAGDAHAVRELLLVGHLQGRRTSCWRCCIRGRYADMLRSLLRRRPAGRPPAALGRAELRRRAHVAATPRSR